MSDEQTLTPRTSTGNYESSPSKSNTFTDPQAVTHSSLNDWELAKSASEDASKEHARQPGRTGTWQFMSVLYVRQPESPVKRGVDSTVPDDLCAPTTAPGDTVMSHSAHVLSGAPPALDRLTAHELENPMHEPGAGVYGEVLRSDKEDAVKGPTDKPIDMD